MKTSNGKKAKKAEIYEEYWKESQVIYPFAGLAAVFAIAEYVFKAQAELFTLLALVFTGLFCSSLAFLSERFRIASHIGARIVFLLLTAVVWWYVFGLGFHSLQDLLSPLVMAPTLIVSGGIFLLGQLLKFKL